MASIPEEMVKLWSVKFSVWIFQAYFHRIAGTYPKPGNKREVFHPSIAGFTRKKVNFAA